MDKAGFIAKKFAQLLFTLYAIATFNFLLFRILPGDPLRLIARAGRLSPDAVARLQELFGLDRSRWEQYLIYLKNIATGEYGISITFRRPVMDIIAERMSNTILLLLVATIIVIVIGVGLGIFASMRRGTGTDNTLIVASMVGWSLPTFWTGLLFIIVFGVYLHALPIAGVLTPGAVYTNYWQLIGDYANHLILPTVSLVIVDMAQFFLITRNTLVDVLTEDYITTAKGKGLSPLLTMRRHALPNAMLPIITTLALYVSLVIGGAIQVETVFSYPGMGKLMYDAVLRRDYPILEATFFLMASVTVLANFISDVVYRLIDPRVKNI
ncbi:MAG: ABC transporter permease [Anaerovoracaceae bacterium]